jgi:hypothetical protein
VTGVVGVDPVIEIVVDASNPGQFFACCGLLELADRAWGGAEGWFTGAAFRVRAAGVQSVDGVGLDELLRTIAAAPLVQDDLDDQTASPLMLGVPFGLHLDWWRDERGGGSGLKVWAGRMNSTRIAGAMQAVVAESRFATPTLFDVGMVVFDPAKPTDKVEPFYFDARRGAASRPLDIGFSPDALQLTSVAYPAVEFLCFVGLQRFRPLTIGRRMFEYQTWSIPLLPEVAAAAACRLETGAGGQGFRFENAFRTDQRKHKAFVPATALTGADDDRRGAL